MMLHFFDLCCMKTRTIAWGWAVLFAACGVEDVEPPAWQVVVNGEAPGGQLFLEAGDLVAFLAEDRLVIHNAGFDLRFLNAEFAMLGLPAVPGDRAVDTVQMSRRRFPGAPAGLDALCRRFGIDNSARTKHGALLDAELLAEVYLELLGGRQTRLSLAQSDAGAAAAAAERPYREPRPHAPTAAEAAAHATFLAAELKDPIWLRT